MGAHSNIVCVSVCVCAALQIMYCTTAVYSATGNACPRDPEWLQRASVPAPAEGLAMQPQCVWLSDMHLETDFARPIHKAWPSRRNACRAVVCSLPWTGRLLLTRPHCRIQCKYTVDGRPVRGRCRKPSQHVHRGRSRSRGTRDEVRGTM